MSARLRRWYRRLSSTHQARLIRFGPIAVMLVLVISIWIYLNVHGGWITDNRTLTKIVGIASLYGALVAVLGSRRWSLINIGLLSYLIADAAMLLRLLARVGPQPVSMRELNLIRSFFTVGAVAIIIALTAWMIQTRAGVLGPDAQWESTNVTNLRRSKSGLIGLAVVIAVIAGAVVLAFVL